MLPADAGEVMVIRFALSQEQLALVDRLIASGRYEAQESVIGAALTLLEMRERERLDQLTALHDALIAEDDCAADGDGGADVAGPCDTDLLDEIERLIAAHPRAAALKQAC
ncbi:type II toxin-antitoxin system ParD family antitoxin [Xanthobacter sp. KR7-225]|uniref:type II toxin-antitoxin system ParD family antitoxin n=1 Tax=Xanthobacter sp. KR7-225 TaxID=3156613 RepID=UPI0032B45706